MDRFLKELIVTSKEILNKIESLVMKIENSIEENKAIDDDTINTLFREFHTIKGNSGFFGLPNIVNVAHTAESLLNDVRNKAFQINQNFLDFIIESKDFLDRGFEIVERTGNDIELKEESNFLNAKLKLLIEVLHSGEKIKSSPEKKDFLQSNFGVFEDELEIKSNTESVKNVSPNFGIFEDEPGFKLDTPQTKNDSPGIGEPNANLEEEQIKNISQSANVLDDNEKAKQSPKFNKDYATKTIKNKSEIVSSEFVKSEIRIDIKKIDFLINSIGELVIAESLVTQSPEIKDLNLKNFDLASENLNKTVKFIQDISLSLRMLPIESIFQKMERLVRDLSKKTNKKVSLETEGNETEVDKNILENIADPIMHIIRNSIDHGIEYPEERIKNSKKEKGTIFLKVTQSGSEVIIIILDDGKGLDRDKLLKKAKESNLLTKEEREYTDEEVWEMIFLPGFSTAEVVTDISGRGVGMDVVRKNVNALNGEIFIESQKNVGTKITIHIPLTLAIIEGMIAVNRNRFFIIPTVDIREVFNYKELKLSNIDEKDKVIKFREKLIPIIDFQSLIQNKAIEINEEKCYVIVVESKKSYLAIIFDDIIGYHNIVIKQMSELFSHLREYSGCTILGNGDIGLILDIRYLVDRFLNYKY